MKNKGNNALKGSTENTQSRESIQREPEAVTKGKSAEGVGEGKKGNKALKGSTEKTQSLQREPSAPIKGSGEKIIENLAQAQRLSSELVNKGSAEKSAEKLDEKSAERAAAATAKLKFDTGTKGSAETITSKSSETTKSAESQEPQPRTGKPTTVPLSIIGEKKDLSDKTCVEDAGNLKPSLKSIV